MKDKKILKELRNGPMKSMKDDEYAMIEKEVDEKGIAGLKGYAKSMIEKAMRDMAYEMKKAVSVSRGDMVSWNSSGGTATGKIVRIVRDGKINVPDSSFSIEGSEDDPAALIQLYRDGKPTETKVGHKVSTLKKKQEYLSTVATTKAPMVRGRTESTALMTPKVKIPPSQRTQRVQRNFIPTMMTQKKNTKNWMPMTQSGWMTWTS